MNQELEDIREEIRDYRAELRAIADHVLEQPELLKLNLAEAKEIYSKIDAVLDVLNTIEHKMYLRARGQA